MPKPLVFFGGSFNPPTLAHRAMADHVLKLRPEAEIMVAPVFHHRFVAKSNLADYQHRLVMTRLAFPDLTVSEIEKTVFEASATGADLGTIDTLEYIKFHAHPFDGDVNHLSLILGGDAYQDFISGKWKRADKILDIVDHLYVFQRNGTVLEPILEKVTIIVDDNISHIASTKMRENIHSAAQWLAPSVFEYIEKNRLYR
jgi:nicotinate-nucleotide adenylyltransferase